MKHLVASVPLVRREDWDRLLSEHHDVLVVGGGIHGAGVARDAALRGLRVAVIDQNDWAAGTSSRSSKLLHGGLRYLRQGAVGLVRESLRERELHLKLAPDLVHRLRFRVPPPPSVAPPLWQIRAGIAAYDLLTRNLHRSRFWDEEPTYEDAALDDARFCLEIVLDARRHGALALSYVQWLEWVRKGGRIVAARIRDGFTGEEGRVSATAFVNAAGPWAGFLTVSPRRSTPLLRLTRGTHIFLDRRADDDARLFFSPEDGRALFLLPFDNGTSLLSTTDLDEPAPTKDPIPTRREVRYLRDAFRAQFPDWKHWRPVGAQCGLRPLLAGEGPPSAISREEKILVDPSGSLVSILGGKYTTFRSVAETAVDRVERMLGKSPGGHPTRSAPIPGSGRESDPHAQIRRAFAEEDAVRLEDVFLRRTTLGHRGRVPSELMKSALKLWRLRWGKSEEAAEAEREAFLSLEEKRLAPLDAWDG